MVPSTRRKETTMSTANEIAENYIATWNETDADARAALIARHWS